jgi:hypothetical protein
MYLYKVSLYEPTSTRSEDEQENDTYVKWVALISAEATPGSHEALEPVCPISALLAIQHRFSYFLFRKRQSCPCALLVKN